MKKMSYDELMELGILLRRYHTGRMKDAEGQRDKVLAEYDRLEPLIKEIDAAAEKAQKEEHIEF